MIMRKLLLGGVILSALSMPALAAPIEETPLEMYALGAQNTAGVFKFNPTDWGNPTRISGTTYVQYTGGPVGSAGTFLNSEKVVGVKLGASYYYPFEATATGVDGNPWQESYFDKSMSIFYNVIDMTYDEKNDVVYCWYAFSDYAQTLGIYDPNTKTITRIGNSSTSKTSYPPCTIAIDNEGQLWGVGAFGFLYSIDKTTGMATEVTNSSGTGVQIASTTPASAAFDPATNLMYVVAKTGSDTYSSLWTIDLTTKKGSKVASLPNATYYNCLYVVGSSVAAGAPAEAENLAAEFNGKKTVVTFTAPTMSSDGAALEGELTYTITVDGDEDNATTGTVEAGGEVSVELELESGERAISVVMSNADGESKAAKTTVWSGYDEPTAVSDLQIAVVDGKIKLTWAKPVGKNGGALDTENITYSVSKDDQVLESGLGFSDTEYSMPIDWKYILCSFNVTVVYDGKEESKSTSIMAGLPYAVPYTLDLANVEDLSSIGVTVFDLDRATATNESWKIGTVNDEPVLQSLFANIYNTRNDYAYLPPLSLKAGVQYIFKFKMAVYTSSNFDTKAEIRLLSAASPTTESDKYNVVQTLEILPSKEYDWVNYYFPVTVPVDGNYAFGVADILTQETIDAGTRKNYNVNLKNIGVVENFFVPDTVADLAAAVQTDNNRNVDLSFKLPTVDTEAQPFNKSITKVEIYRGETLIDTKTGSFAPGTEMTYPDADAPVGIQTYSVKVYDGEKVAEDAAAVTVAVGYAYNLAIETVSAPEEAVEPNGAGTITVKVTNDAYNAVEAKAYSVVLKSGEETIETLEGAALAAGASADYSFKLNYEGPTPATVTYTVSADFVPVAAETPEENADENPGENPGENPDETPFVSPDENPADNTTEDIEVKFVTGAPAKVADLTATPQEDNNSAIDIAFTLPTKDVKGANLTSISKYEILRGTEVISEESGELTPGEKITYTDEDAPLGPTSYSVKTYNGEQASEAVTVNVAVGYDHYLAVETVSAPEEAVEPNGEGKIVVKVNNGGYETIAADAYSVVLMSGEKEIETQEGSALEPGKDAQFTFTLNYEGATPATVTYQVNVVLADEEYHLDNTTGDFEVTFETGSPVKVEDLTATPQEDNKRNIDIAFTLPTKDEAGADLTSISKYEILRDEEVIVTKEGTFEPGAEITYTDEKVAIGEHQYAVVVYNGENSSETATIEAASGYGNNLSIAAVSAPEDAVEPNGEGEIKVKVTNTGYNDVAAEAYEVVLLCNGEQADKAESKAIAAGEEAEFTFTLNWEDATPATVNYQVKVVFESDENEEDDTTEEIEVTFETGAPAKVADLKAAPQEDNNLNIDITFTLPTKDTAGAELSSISKVEIFRGTEVIKTLDADLEPGAPVSYTDENAPKGVRSYGVVVYSNGKASAKASVSVGVGYANNLAIETVSAPEEAVEPNGEGEITVKVTNDGYKDVAVGAYEVILLCNGEQADKAAGKALATDASAEYTFVLNWEEATPATAKYQVKVVFEDDSNEADDATDEIEVTFRTGAPVKVDDLKAEVEADNNRNVVLTFTLPTKDTAGADLSSIDKVEIKRGTVLIKTLDTDLEPGAPVTYTDKDAPRGITSYSVIVYEGGDPSKAATVSVKVGYVNNLQIETVAAPTEPIAVDGEGTITVKVTNDGFEQVLEGAYEVALFCGEEKVDSKTGEALATEASAEYSFEIAWTAESPSSAEYTVKVIFQGDENEADNATEAITVVFRSTSGIGEVSAENIVISANAGSIVVKNAEGCVVKVFSTDGHLIVNEVADADYATPALNSGVYIVNVCGVTKKIALRAY